MMRGRQLKGEGRAETARGAGDEGYLCHARGFAPHARRRQVPRSSSASATRRWRRS
jgi:hypothetical protein